jgi:hypothetical protein
LIGAYGSNRGLRAKNSAGCPLTTRLWMTR